MRPHNSLKTRITLGSLGIFLVSLWSLELYTSQLLRRDMERLLSHQMMSVASSVATQIDKDLSYRSGGLRNLAKALGRAMTGNSVTPQTVIEERPLFQDLFNDGIVVLDLDGKVIASVPASAGRLGENHLVKESVAATLKTGALTFGRATKGRPPSGPTFDITVPVLDSQGKLVGAVSGLTDLGKPGFLDHVTYGRYGNSGNFGLVAPQYRQIITSSDSRRRLEILPERGVHAVLDRRLEGYEGIEKFVNIAGDEVIGLAKKIPVAGWILILSLPTAEAFVPLNDLLTRTWAATAILTLVVGCLIWFNLKRQLSPLVSAANLLSDWSKKRQPLLPLPVTNDDEIGELVTGFNGVLKTLAEREEALQQANASLQTSLRDKEALLKEVHHRVKNNLQVITSLLRLERGRSDNASAQAVLQAMQDRVRSMALLHESIYRAGTFASIDLGSYLSEVATQTFSTLLASPASIQLRLELGSVQVGLDQATPCGLLVSELLSNALKHGFPDERTGEVWLTLKPMDASKHWRLSVTDNGVGLPEDFESKRQESLGLQLVSSLATQMGGVLSIDQGSTFAIEFEIKPPSGKITPD